ncbi:MAG: MotA/TolQ/ExbB proton channel family protein [Phycisphaeraceae bacterium]|nr:MotA/TolQ/ExbB proton channel family protein [Phycisphaerae bacterium]MBX3391534.1 MotA/TolQ/ExbB proton channel family protein [Phycisphaeraceae bacterium]HRJ49343.1 MotA/TolQ/ExbB proton channel family protein [Phycisphaerales bacterium]
MDKSSVIGSILGLVCCTLVGFMASGGNWGMFWSEKGVIMVFGGSISVIFMAMPMEKIKCIPGYVKRFFLDKGVKPTAVIAVMNELSEKARRDGILALEAEVARIEDKFLASGMKMAIDGVDPTAIETTLRMEVMAMQDRHKAGKKFFDLIKLYAPGYGLVATLIGQVGMFGGLASADIGHLGHMLAVAVVATMYGTVLANAVAGPIGDKLSLRSSEEILGREMMLQGILSIQAGDNPRITLDKMLAFIPGPARGRFRQAA